MHVKNASCCTALITANVNDDKIVFPVHALGFFAIKMHTHITGACMYICIKMYQ